MSAFTKNVNIVNGKRVRESSEDGDDDKNDESDSRSSEEISAADALGPKFMRNLRYPCKNPGDLTMEEIKDLEAEGRMNDTTDEVSFQPHYGLTALTRAMKQNDEELIDKVLSIPGTDINARNADNNQTTQLAVACEHFPQYLEKLLAVPGIDVNDCDGFGWTPLTILLKYHPERVKLLLKHPGIDVNKPNKDGVTPLSMTIQLSSYRKIVKLLLSNGADTSSESLLIVAVYANPKIIPLLVEHGATVTFKCLKDCAVRYKWLTQVTAALPFLLESKVLTAEEGEVLLKELAE